MKKKSIKIFSLLICLAITISMFAGCGKIKGIKGIKDINNISGTVSEEKLSKKIELSSAIAADGSMVVFAKNNNKKDVNLEITVEFYDEDGMILDIEYNYVYIFKGGAETACEIYIGADTYDTYKIYADATEVDTSFVKDYRDDIEITHKDAGDKVLIQIKNNASDEIETISACVVYYKGDTVVGVDEETVYDVKSERYAKMESLYPYDENYDDIDFDTYKVFIKDAITWDY